MKLTRVFQNGMVAAVAAAALLFTPAANAQVFISAGIAPPAIPVYVQPPCPGYGYIWTPGYWAYGPDGYYWVDGAWVVPPYEGALWTPGYWGWGDQGYLWNPGYWGLSVGYYGGINYGFGYFGTGFYGGYWRGGRLFYNGEYNRFGFHDHDGFIYRQRVGGFDGRPGGLAFARNGGHGLEGGRDFNRGSGINGHSFATAGHGPEQVGFRNGYTSNGARPQYAGADRGNGQQFRGGYNVQQGRGFAAGNTQSFRGGYSASQAGAGQFRGGSNAYSAPQARSYAGGNYGMRSRSGYSAPAAPQVRSYGGGGNFGGGSRASFGGGSRPSFGGGSRPSFGGGGAPSGGGSHGSNGGGFHGAGGGGFHGGGGGRR